MIKCLPSSEKSNQSITGGIVVITQKSLWLVVHSAQRRPLGSLNAINPTSICCTLLWDVNSEEAEARALQNAHTLGMWSKHQQFVFIWVKGGEEVLYEAFGPFDPSKEDPLRKLLSEVEHLYEEFNPRLHRPHLEKVLARGAA